MEAPQLTDEWRPTRAIAEEAGATREEDVNRVRDELERMLASGHAEVSHEIVEENCKHNLQWRAAA